MMKILRILVISILISIMVPFASLAVTEYPWEGSAKDVERAGGLGWITVTQSLVLPGTKECNVMVFQSGDDRWGYMAGEEDPDEFKWIITLYEEDDFTARIQLPFSTYEMYYLGIDAIPDHYKENLPQESSISWFVLNDLMLAESGQQRPDSVTSSCRLSEDFPEGLLSNNLIMIYTAGSETSYTKDISYLFKSPLTVSETERYTTEDVNIEKNSVPTPFEEKELGPEFQLTEQSEVKKFIHIRLFIALILISTIVYFIIRKNKKHE